MTFQDYLHFTEEETEGALQSQAEDRAGSIRQVVGRKSERDQFKAEAGKWKNKTFQKFSSKTGKLISIVENKRKLT